MSQVSQSNADQLVAVIQIDGGDNEVRHTMEDGSSLMLGCDPQCGVMLEAPGIAPRHCVIHMADGKIFVTDWYSDSGTFVNGEKIYTETCLRPMDRMNVGPFQIRYIMSTQSGAGLVSFAEAEAGQDAEQSVDSQHEISNPRMDPMPAAPEPVSMMQDPSAALDDIPVAEMANQESSVKQIEMPVNQLETPVGQLETPVGQLEMPAEMNNQLQSAHEEIERLNRELDYQKALASMNELDSSSPYDGLGSDESELLRAEVEHLQTELSRRENEVQEMLNKQQNEYLDGDGDATETSRLVERLDQLLAELQDSDERVRNLETLLQASEDATHAEREEREQLGYWVSEIESKISDREKHWQVQQERLETQLEEAVARYERAESNVEQVVKLHATEYQQNMQKQVAELNQRNSQLVGELETSQSAYAQLEKLVSEVGVSQDEMKEMAAKQDEMRQHEVEIAQERALITRQRSEIAQIRHELEQAAGKAQDVENPDCRIRQFREHLREIHETEQQEHRQRSLGSRISRLWKRVDDN